MGTHLVARGRTRPALWRRSERERRVADNGDSYFVAPAERALAGLEARVGWLFAVGDGLGGEGNDDLASQTAMSALEACFTERAPLLLEPGDGPEIWLQTAYAYVNQRVCEERDARNVGGMFTTLTTALVICDQHSQPVLFPANVGDSRLYLLRNAELTQLTRDDGAGGYVTRVIGDPALFSTPLLRTATTVVRAREHLQLLNSEMRSAVQERFPGLTSRDTGVLTEILLGMIEGSYPLELMASLDPAQLLLISSIGWDRFSASVTGLGEVYEQLISRHICLTLQPGDRLMLCSDGISNAFGAPFLEDALGARDPSRNPGEVLDDVLTHLMEAHGRIDDDRTAVLVEVVG